MKTHLAATLCVVFLMALLSGRNASANGTFAVTLADYNGAQVANSGYLVSVPYGSTVGSTTYSAIYSVTSGTVLQANSRFTITLPSGFTFNSQPTLYSSFIGQYATLVGSAINSSTAVFTIPADTKGDLTIGAFALSVPTSFGSQFGGSTASMSVQATNNSSTINDDPNPIPQPAFTHAVGSLPDTITPGSGQIDLAFPFYGDQFVPGGATTQGSAQVAVFAINTEFNDPFNGNAQVLTPNGQVNSLSPSDTTNIAIYGYFNGIGQAYASSSIGTCQTTIPAGAFTGSVTTTSISFSGIKINTPMQICMIANAVMWQNLTPYVYTYSAGSGVTDYYGGLSQTTADNFYTYSTAPNITILSGTPQKTPINTAFPVPFSVKVTDASARPLQGINVIFTPPPAYLNGPSGAFTGNFGGGFGTDANGVATSSAFSANSIACNYVLKATVGATNAYFSLFNEPTNLDMIFCNGFDD